MRGSVTAGAAEGGARLTSASPVWRSGTLSTSCPFGAPASTLQNLEAECTSLKLAYSKIEDFLE